MASIKFYGDPFLISLSFMEDDYYNIEHELNKLFKDNEKLWKIFKGDNEFYQIFVNTTSEPIHKYINQLLTILKFCKKESISWVFNEISFENDIHRGKINLTEDLKVSIDENLNVYKI